MEKGGLICNTEMCKNISNRLSEIALTGRLTLRREIRLPFLYLFTPLSINQFLMQITRGEGGKKYKKFADIINGSPLMGLGSCLNILSDTLSDIVDSALPRLIVQRHLGGRPFFVFSVVSLRSRPLPSTFPRAGLRIAKHYYVPAAASSRTSPAICYPGCVDGELFPHNS